MKNIILLMLFYGFSVNLSAQSDYSQFMRIKKLFNQKKYYELININSVIKNNSEFYHYTIFYKSVSYYKINQKEESLKYLNQIRNENPNWSQIDEVYFWIVKIVSEKNQLKEAMYYFSLVSEEDILSDLYPLIDPLIKKINSFNQLKKLYEEYPKNKSIAKYYGRMLLREYLSDEVINKINKILSIVKKEDLFISDNKKFKIALLLPFMYEGLNNNYYIKNNDFIMDLYAGMLYGLDMYDSINSMIELIAYDTKRDPEVVRRLTNDGSLDGMNLIIGPLYGKPISIIKQYCLENKILMINPLSSNNQIIDDNKYSLLYKPSIKTIANKASEYAISKFSNNKNVIIFYEKNYQDSLIASIYTQRLNDEKFNIIYSKSVSLEDSRLILDSLASTYEEILSDSLYDTLQYVSGLDIKDGRGIDDLDTTYKYIERFFIEDDSIGHIFVSSKNSLFASNVVSAIDIRSDTIPVIGFDDWLDYNVITVNQFQELNISLISPSYYNSSSQEYIEINEYFFKNYSRNVSDNFINGLELINMIISINENYGNYFQFGLRNEELISGKISLGAFYKKYNDNQVVPVVRVYESEIVPIN
ncbi:MAG: ABC transporter substrate-binding protein [Bacteroidota bacterium]|nr:ABC transporter substrate-binding protein [Bacteroidota bacterium]